MKKILKLGWTGAEVAAAEKRLDDLGYLTEKKTGAFTAAMKESVRRFQSDHDLLDDGVIGPFTWAALFPQDEEHAEHTLPPVLSGDIFARLRELAVRSAQQELGTKEIGKNRGPVEKYMTLLGFEYDRNNMKEPGPPYCRGFEYWNFQRAADELKIKNPAVKTAHVMTGYREEKKRGWIIDVDDAQRGDCGRMRFGNDTGHSLIIAKRQPGAAKLISFEANTSASGTTVAAIRDGEGVMQKARSLDSLFAVCRVGGA